MAVDLSKPRPTPVRLRSVAVPSLRPYVRGWAHVARALWSGSAVLGRRLWAARRAPRLVATVRASGVVSLGGAFAGACVAIAVWGAVGRYVVLICTGAAGVWVVLALMHSHPEPVPAERADVVEQAPADDAPYDPRAAFVQHLRAAIGARNGVHLRELIARPPLEHLTIAEVRVLCDRYQVPVRRVVKVGNVPTVGVHRDDLQPLSPTAPQETPLAG